MKWFYFLKQKREEKKKAEVLEKEILNQKIASKENEEFLLLIKELKLLKEEIPVFLPEIDFKSQEKSEMKLKAPMILRPALAGVGVILIFLAIFLPNLFSPKFSGLNKKAIAKEKELIKKQILVHKETEKKAEVILKNL